MPDAQLSLATSLVDGMFHLLDKLVWPVFLVFVLSKPVVLGWMTMLVERIAEAVEVRHGRSVVKFPPRPVSSFVVPEKEKILDRLPVRTSKPAAPKQSD